VTGSPPQFRLITHPDEPVVGRVFLHHNGRRHWVPSVEHLAGYGLTLASTVQVPVEEILSIPRGGSIPREWPAWRGAQERGRDPLTIREIACSPLSGSGIEFGAGTNPLPVPIHCEVRYADVIGEVALKGAAYAEQGVDFVTLNLVSDMQTMDGAEEESLDFVAACHVIEHLPNPLLALRSAYRKLKTGGYLVLVVPDILRTFDRNRALTTLDHLISDYEDPNRERDLRHYLEWFTRVNPVPPEALYGTVLQWHLDRRDIHYHTWTHASFQEMVHWVQGNLDPWTSVWSHPGSSAREANEFYFVLEK